MLVVEYLIYTRVRDFLVRAENMISRHKVVPELTLLCTCLMLDVIKGSRRWPVQWHFSSDFRIIKISQNMF